MIMVIKRSDHGMLGVVLTTFVHLQIYLLLFVLQWAAFKVGELASKIEA
jgi:hypothetical protein